MKIKALILAAGCFCFVSLGYAANSGPTQGGPYVDEKERVANEVNPFLAHIDGSLSEEKRIAETQRRYELLAGSKYPRDRASAAMFNSDLISHYLPRKIGLRNLKQLLSDPDSGVRAATIAGFNSCTGYAEDFGRAALPIFKAFLNHPDPKTRDSIQHLYLYYKSPEEYSRRMGAAAAEKDIAEEIRGILVLGNETGWKKRFVQLVEQQSLEVNSAPTSVPDEAGYVRGYNETMNEALSKAYGYDWFGVLEKQAKVDLAASSAGEKQAQADMKKGRFKLIVYGYSDDESIAFARALKKRYGIDTDGRGCIAEEGETEFASSYNAAIRRELIEKFGVDVIAATEKEFYPEPEKSQAQKDGENAARAEVTSGRYAVYVDLSESRWGWEPYYMENLKSSGIEILDRKKGDLEKGEDFCGGYNNVAYTECEKRFGKYVFERARNKARGQFKASKAASKNIPPK